MAMKKSFASQQIAGVGAKKMCPVLQGYFCLDLTLQKTTYIDIRVYLQSKP